MKINFHRKFRIIILFSLLGSPLFPASSTFAAETQKISRKKIKDMVAAAKTAEDHQAIAQYYSEEAAQAKEKAAEHKEMASWYKERRELGKNTIYVPNQQHCDMLVKNYEALAQEYAALAKSHEEQAKQLRANTGK